MSAWTTMGYVFFRSARQFKEEGLKLKIIRIFACKLIYYD